MRLQEEQQRDSTQLNNLKKEKKQTTTALNNLMKAIEAGIISVTTKSRLHELEELLSELESKILAEESKQSILLEREQIEAYNVQALKLEAERLIHTLIKEIVLYNDKIEIYLNSPLRTSPDENRGFSFYTEVVNMPTERHATRSTKYKRITLQMLV